MQPESPLDPSTRGGATRCSDPGADTVLLGLSTSPTPDETPRVTRTTLARAFTWTSAGTAFSYILALVRSIVLARLLSPEDFGLFGLAVAFLTTAQMLTEFSLYQRILVKPFRDPVEERLYLDTIWTAELVRRGLLSALLVVAAYPASIYFRDARLVFVLALIALVPILGACRIRA